MTRKTQAHSKKYGGELTKWSIHNLSSGLKVMTAVVVSDPLNRWEEGWTMRSSPVLNIDREKGIVETLNTIYSVDDNEIKEDYGDFVKHIYF